TGTYYLGGYPLGRRALRLAHEPRRLAEALVRGLGDVRVRRVVLDAGLEAPRRPRQQAVLEAQQAAVQRDRGAVDAALPDADGLGPGPPRVGAPLGARELVDVCQCEEDAPLVAQHHEPRAAVELHAQRLLVERQGLRKAPLGVLAVRFQDEAAGAHRHQGC
ncbi:unnamed protein product, partial [Pelagomonas calceolata]